MSGNWSNALRHIKSLHPTELAEEDQTTLKNAQFDPAASTASASITSTKASSKGSSAGSSVTIPQTFDSEYVARKKQKRVEAERIMPLLLETVITGNLLIKRLDAK